MCWLLFSFEQWFSSFMGQILRIWTLCMVSSKKCISLDMCYKLFFFLLPQGSLDPRPTLLRSLISKLIFCWGYIICTNSGVFFCCSFVILEELDNEKYTFMIEKQRMTKNSKPSIILLILEIMLYQQCMCFAMHKTWCLLCTVFIFSLY